ncbi:MAG: hypothetical protein IH914_07245 [candidate division Zixibacteria bacterium]|nr:hypothetical protein [candidate division Zixibacteria bacterium]
MSWGSDSGQDGRDWAKISWFGVIAMIIVMIAALWLFTGGETVVQTRARAKHILINFDRATPEDIANSLEFFNGLRPVFNYDLLLHPVRFKRQYRRHD